MCLKEPSAELPHAHGQLFVEAAYWGYVRTQPLCPTNSILLLVFFPLN